MAAYLRAGGGQPCRAGVSGAPQQQGSFGGKAAAHWAPQKPHATSHLILQTHMASIWAWYFFCSGARLSLKVGVSRSFSTVKWFSGLST